jgi:hypothetical protein
MLCAAVALGGGSATRAELKRVAPKGYAVGTTAEGDFDGDGKREVAVEIYDAALAHGATPLQYMQRVEQGLLLGARVLVVKPRGRGFRAWKELPWEARDSEGGISTVEVLRAMDLTGDGRPEIVVISTPVMGGSRARYEVCVCTYRGGKFEEIWASSGIRFTSMGYGEFSRALPGKEIVVAEAPPYNGGRIPWEVRTYGYHGGKYELLSKRLSVGRYDGYHGGAEVLKALGARPFRRSHESPPGQG